MAFEMLMNMAEFHYREHYKQHISKNLTKKQKEAIMKKISNMTLESAIWMDRDTDYKKDFPEIAPYVTESVPLSGLYLVAIMKEIFQELNPTTAKNIGIYQKKMGEKQ